MVCLDAVIVNPSLNGCRDFFWNFGGEIRILLTFGGHKPAMLAYPGAFWEVSLGMNRLT